MTHSVLLGDVTPCSRYRDNLTRFYRRRRVPNEMFAFVPLRCWCSAGYSGNNLRLIPGEQAADRGDSVGGEGSENTSRSLLVRNHA